MIGDADFFGSNFGLLCILALAVRVGGRGCLMPGSLSALSPGSPVCLHFSLFLLECCAVWRSSFLGSFCGVGGGLIEWCVFQVSV